jgi:hypothetical protein
LIDTAATAAVGALTKAAAEPALAAGRAVWTWITGKATGEDAATVAAIEAAPAKPSARTKVTALLQDALHDNPQAAADLQGLLDKAGGVQAITQTANVTGDGNKLANIAGAVNTVTMS